MVIMTHTILLKNKVYDMRKVTLIEEEEFILFCENNGTPRTNKIIYLIKIFFAFIIMSASITFLNIIPTYSKEAVQAKKYFKKRREGLKILAEKDREEKYKQYGKKWLANA